MSSTGGKVAQIVAFVVGVALVVAGLRQCSAKSETTATTAGTSTTVSGADGATTTTTPAGGAGPTAVLTTTTLTRTTLLTMSGTFAVTPAGTSFATSYPYPVDPAQRLATPVIEWKIAVPAGQKLEIRGPAPGTAEATLSRVPNGQFVPCPGALKGDRCESAAGTYTYAAVLLEGDTVVSRKTVTVPISASAAPLPKGGGV